MSAATTSASMSRRRSTRSALTLRMPELPIPAPQIVTIFMRPPRMDRLDLGRRWSAAARSVDRRRVVEDVGELGDDREVVVGGRDREAEDDAHRIVVRMPEVDGRREGHDREAVGQHLGPGRAWARASPGAMTT